MKTLLLLRHAKSSWKDGSMADHDRGLNRRGEADAPRMGTYLRDQGLLLFWVSCDAASNAPSGVAASITGWETLAASGGPDGGPPTPESPGGVVDDFVDQCSSIMVLRSH